MPVDYSEPSARVLRFAAALAARTGGTLTVLHVWECMPDAPKDVMVKGRDGKTRRLEEVIRDNAAAEMKQFLAGAKLPEGVSTISRLESGDAGKRILELLGSGAYDLVVMGTHGRGGVSHLMMGSVAEKVTRSSPVPVLTVPNASKER